MFSSFFDGRYNIILKNDNILEVVPFFTKKQKGSWMVDLQATSHVLIILKFNSFLLINNKKE